MIFIDAHHLEDFRAFFHLCYYFPDERDEYFSSTILEFKEGEEDAIEFWLDWVEYDFQYEIFEGIRFGLVLRVLGHSELEAVEEKPLDLIGQKIVEVKGGEYNPRVIGKQRANKKLSHTNSKEEREAELEENYYLMDEEYEDYGRNVLIIDDIKTSGTSMEAVKDLLRESGFTGRIYGFALGETERNDLTKNDDIEVPELDDE